LKLEILSPGGLCMAQDAGRPGFRRLGIPPAGAMDPAAMRLANRLLDNPPAAPVLECLHGARFRVLEPGPIALAGFGHARAWQARAGELIAIGPELPGVWHALALPGGLAARRWLDSASVCPRAGLGAPLMKGERVDNAGANGVGTLPSDWPTGVKCRYPADAQLEAAAEGAPPIRVWPGPQWAELSEAARRLFFSQSWRVSPRSDRAGYRLEGEPVPTPAGNLASEGVRVGSIQVPPDGQPIVTLHDGPTVGGYAKIALIDADDLRRLVQTRPGQSVCFRRMA
jgi:biotin-dependent carboxylase-like uncharacterized protein